MNERMPIEQHLSAQSERIIPLILKEFQEIPPGYVSVFRTTSVSRQNLERIATQGYSIEANLMQTRHPELESIFQRAAQRYNIPLNRTRVIFAYPRPPEVIQYGQGRGSLGAFLFLNRMFF